MPNVLNSSHLQDEVLRFPVGILALLMTLLGGVTLRSYLEILLVVIQGMKIE